MLTVWLCCYLSGCDANCPHVSLTVGVLSQAGGVANSLGRHNSHLTRIILAYQRRAPQCCRLLVSACRGGLPASTCMRRLSFADSLCLHNSHLTRIILACLQEGASVLPTPCVATVTILLAYLPSALTLLSVLVQKYKY
jgi:hypothetical protein